jgi:hypothetical protein
VIDGHGRQDFSWNGVDFPNWQPAAKRAVEEAGWDRIGSHRLPSQIADGSSAHLALNRHMAGVIGHKETQTQVHRAHALYDGFAVPPFNEPFQRSKETLPSVSVDPTGTGAREALARQADVQTNIAVRRMGGIGAATSSTAISTRATPSVRVIATLVCVDLPDVMPHHA